MIYLTKEDILRNVTRYESFEEYRHCTGNDKEEFAYKKEEECSIQDISFYYGVAGSLLKMEMNDNSIIRALVDLLTVIDFINEYDEALCYTEKTTVMEALEDMTNIYEVFTLDDTLYIDLN